MTIKTITLQGDFITVETLTRWIRAAFEVVAEFDRAVGDEVRRVLRVRE